MRILALASCVLLASFVSSTTALANDVPHGGSIEKPGQFLWRFTSNNGARDANKWYQYTEINPDFPEEQRNAIRMSRLDRNGQDERWTARNTELTGGCIVNCPPPKQKDNNAPEPGGNMQVDFVPSTNTTYPLLTVGAITIDSDTFPSGPSTSTDPLIGGVISVTPMDDYNGSRHDGVPSFGAIFSSSTGGRVEVRKNGSLVLSANFAELANAPGETALRATLSSVAISNSIGSSILSQLESALSRGDVLSFDVIPGSGQNLALATRDTMTGECYMLAASVTGRAGISAYIPGQEVPTVSELAWIALACTVLLSGVWLLARRAA